MDACVHLFVTYQAVFISLNGHGYIVSGSWAVHCEIDYSFPFHQNITDLTYDHFHLDHLSKLLSRLNHFYERLLKLELTVSKEIQMEVAEKFLEALVETWKPGNQVPPPLRSIHTEDILCLFQNAGKR